LPDFAVTPPPQISLPVVGDFRRFPVRRIYCVGRNYADHIREMGGGPEREQPFFFMKPADAIVATAASIAYPCATRDFQHEIELVLAIGEVANSVDAARAAEHVFGVAAGIDLTRRDLQLRARKAGRPWEEGKSFDQSAPCGPVRPLDGAPLPQSGRITLSVNRELRQDGDLSQMIWSAAEIVANLSHLFELRPGDLIFTGTPAGVGQLHPADRVAGHIEGVGSIFVEIRSREGEFL
jgi:fumarylpyruvate hydrolase